MATQFQYESRIIYDIVFSSEKTQNRLFSLVDEKFFIALRDRFISLRKALSDNSRLTDAQILHYSDKLDASGCLSADIAIEQLKDSYFRNQMSALAHKLSSFSDDPEIDKDYLDKIIGDFRSAIVENRTFETKHISEILETLIGRFKNKKQRPEKITLGYNRLNFAFLEAGNLICLAARPTVGKTSLALNFAARLAKNGISVGFICIEMSNHQIATRLLSIESGYSYESLMYDFDVLDVDVVNRSKNVLSKSPVYVHCGRQVTIKDIESVVNQWVNKHGVGIVFVDYIQKIIHASGESERIRVGKSSYALKAMAMKYQIPIVICSQLNRESQDKKPTMKDIKETGDIEQDADIIILMDRNTNPDELVSREYKFKKNGRLHECDLDIETVLIVCKNRNGKTRNTYLNHDMSCMRFSEHEDTKQPQIPNF